MELNPENEILEITFDHEGAHIALCHKAQGFGANGRPEALLIKSDEVVITDEMQGELDLIKSGVLPDEADKDSLSEGNPDMKDDLKKGQQPSENKLDDKTGDLMAGTDQEKLEKAQADLDAVLLRVEEMEKAATASAAAAEAKEAELTSRIETFEKADNQRVEAAFNAKVETYSFVTPEDKAEFAKTLIELDSVEVVTMLDKAQAAINALDEPQGSDDAQGVELTKSSGLKDMLIAEYGDVK